MATLPTHLKLAEAAHRNLADGAAALALWAAARFVGIDRCDVFRAARYPAKPARTRAVAAYILVTYLDFSGDDAADAVGCADRRHLQRLKNRIVDERDNDPALDAFLDEIGETIASRKAA